MTKEEILIYIEVVSIFITACGALYFGFLQTKINKRMKDLQDYVAISIVPQGKGTSLIKLMNVGKINLYLKQYNIGLNTETFPNPLLVPAGTGEYSNISIFISNLQPLMKMKFYLIDELGKKYISTGQIIVNPLTLPVLGTRTPIQGSTAIPQNTNTVIMPEFQIWVFKTEKYNWMI